MASRGNPARLFVKAITGLHPFDSRQVVTEMKFPAYI